MAVQTIRTDDLNGKPDAQPTIITINGYGVEIDLAADSAARLVKALEPFWAVGNERPYDVVVRKTVREKRRANLSTNGTNGDREFDPIAVRAWAAQNGIEVGDRGRIPRTIVDQFLAAAS